MSNSNNNNSFSLKIQAMLDKVKSLANIKKDLKTLEPKLKVKIKGTLDMVSTKKELNKNLKSIKPKVKVDADTTQAKKKIKKLAQQKTKKTIKPTIDNTQIISDLKATQKETKSLFKRFLDSAVGTNLIRMSVQNVTKAIYEAITGVKELNKVKTDIQTVTGKSNFEVDYIMQDYNSMAKELSSTTKDIAKSANEFLRMGESVASTNELIKSSQMLSKIGMIESSDAASYLLSCLKGYKLEAKDAIDVVSMLSSVDSNATVSAGGLAEALSKCTSVANNSGTSIERLIGYAATIGEVTQESMSVVGNSLKSMYSRFSNIKIGRFIDDGTGESLSDTEAVLNKLGIKLRDSADSYRDFDDILDDVGKRWENFTQVEKNEISVVMDGTMQRDHFLALMDNYSNALKYSEVATNSAGSALEKYGIYQDSIEAKANELTASIESLSTNIISEDLYSGIIKATTGIVEFLDKTNLLKASLSGLVTLGLSKMIVSIGTGIATVVKRTSELTAVMELFKGGRSEENLKTIGKACIGLSDQQLKLVLSTNNLRYEQRKLILEGMGVEEQQQAQTLAALGFANAEKAATASTFSLKNAVKGLGMSIRSYIVSNPILVAIVAFSGLTAGFIELSKAEKKASEKADELYSKSNEQVQKNKEEVKSLEELIAKYKEIKEKGDLDSDDRNQVKKIQNEITDLVGRQAKNLDLVNGKLDKEIQKLNFISEEEAKRSYQEAQANYYNAKDAANKANPRDNKVFFTDYDYAGKIEIGARKALEEAGFGVYGTNGYLTDPSYRGGFGQDGVMGSKMVVMAVGDTVKEKYDYLQQLISVLEQNEQEDTNIYRGLISQVTKYDKYIQDEKTAANNLIDTWITYNQSSNQELKKISVDSVDTFEQYRQKMIEEMSEDKSIQDALTNGTLSEEELEIAIDNYMSTCEDFSEQYMKWQEELLKRNVKEKLQDEFVSRVDELTPEELQIAANLEINSEETKKNIESELKVLEQGGSVNLTLRPKIDTSELNQKGWDVGEGTVTIFSSTFSNETGTVAVNFTPIIADPKTGEYLGVLTPDELQEYAKGVISGIRKDDLNLQIGGQFEGKDAINQAVQVAEKVHGLHEIFFIEDGVFLSWDELIAKIEEYKTSSSAFNSISNFLTASKEKTDEFTSSLKSAYDAYNKLLSPAASSSEILGSLMTMNEAITKMGGKINWEFLGDIPETERLESLGDILNRISIQISDNLKESLHTGNEEYDKFIDTLIKGIAQQQKVASEFEGINGQIDYLQSSYKTLSDVLDAYNETGYMTLDNLQSLLTADENLIAMLEVKNGKLAINQAAYENLVSVQLAEYKTKLENAAAAEIEALAKEKAQKATEQNASASENAVAKIDAETSAIQRNTVAISENEIQKAKDSGVSENEIQQVLDKYNSIWDATQKGFSSGFSSFIGKTASSASKSTEKTLEDMQKEWKEKLDNCLTLYRSELDVGLIDFQTFLDKSKSLMDEYYQSGKISAKDYWDLVKDFYSTQKDIYDEVLSTVSRRYDTEIDRINDTIDGIEKQNDTLEKQKEKYDTILSAVQELIDSKKEEIETSVENLETENEKLDELVSNYDSVLSVVDKVYDTEIEKLQSEQQALDDKIAALQNANEEEEQAIALAKAKYELERAESQRTKLIYKNGQFVYTQDEEAIQEARGNLKNLETEEVIASLEKEKDVLQESIDLLNQYKEMWAEISNVYQDAVDKETAKNILGEDYETMILLNRVLDIEAFKDRYVAAQKQIDDNANLIASYQEKIAYYDKLSEKWNTIADAREKTLNKQLAAELWGSDWETQILEDRLGNFDVFKEEYLTIQDQIEDNTSLIESYQEKITYYENLKDQWSEISKAYENSVNDQYASMILGQNWEAEVLSGRLDTLNQFKDKYQSIQQSISDIAWQAANTRIDAAKEEEKGSQGTKGSVTISAGNTVSSDLSPASSKSHYELYDVRTGQTLASGFNSNEEAVRHIKDVASEAQGREFVKIRKYHKGLEEGYVGKALKDEKLELLQKAGDGSLEKELSSKEVPAILKEGEVVVNEEEQDDVVKALEFIHNMDIKQTPLYKMFFGSEVEQEALKFLPGTWDYKLPKYDTANIIENHTYNNSIVQNITQNFPNAIDISSAKVIESTMGHIMNRTFDKLEMDAYQDSMRRR